MREERVLLALDEGSVFAREPVVLALADVIEGLAQVPHDVELVVENGGLRSALLGDRLKGFPHVHDREADFR